MITIDKNERRKPGRKMTDPATKDKVVSMYKEGALIDDIRKECKLSTATIYRIINERTIEKEKES